MTATCKCTHTINTGARRRRITLNVRRAIRMDPTHTLTLRTTFSRDGVRRFRRVQRLVRQSAPAFRPLTINADPLAAGSLAFQDRPAQFNQYMAWFDQTLKDEVLDNGTQWTDDYLGRAYAKGLQQSFIESKKAGLLAADPLLSGMTAAQYENFAFALPVHREALEFIFLRGYDAMQNVADATRATVARELASGLARGDNPLKVARAINKRVEKIGIVRARAVAQTEVIRAHAEASLNNFESFGLEDVVVLAEWSTAGDDRVCPMCLPMDGEVMKIKEARGLIPRHTNCRCSWLPINAEDAPKGSAKSTQSAVRRSIARQGGTAGAQWDATTRPTLAGTAPVPARKATQSILDRELNRARANAGDAPLAAGSASTGRSPRAKAKGSK